MIRVQIEPGFRVMKVPVQYNPLLSPLIMYLGVRIFSDCIRIEAPKFQTESTNYILYGRW